MYMHKINSFLVLFFQLRHVQFYICCEIIQYTHPFPDHIHFKWSNLHITDWLRWQRHLIKQVNKWLSVTIVVVIFLHNLLYQFKKGDKIKEKVWCIELFSKNDSPAFIIFDLRFNLKSYAVSIFHTYV